MERNRLLQLDRLEREGRVGVDEVEKATETAMRTAEQEADLIIDLKKPISKWRRVVSCQPEWERDHIETEGIIFDRRAKRSWKNIG